MVVVAGVLVLALVVAIAAFLVVREAGRIGRNPPAALFDPDDAYEWVVEHLPDLVAATLDHDDVRRILAYQLEYLESRGAARNGRTAGADGSPGAAVVGGPEELAHILRRAAESGSPYLPEQVQGVLDTQLSYLRLIGAVGPRADDE
jgi:hypothetical protein